MRIIRTVVAAAVVLGAVLVIVPQPASADAPTIEPFYGPFSYNIDCGTVVLREDVVAWGHFTSFSTDGVVTERVGHFTFKGVITNPLTGGTFRDFGAWTERVVADPVTGDPIDDLIGALYHITLPGHGLVVQATGRFVLDQATGELLFQSTHAAATAPQGVCSSLA